MKNILFHITNNYDETLISAQEIAFKYGYIWNGSMTTKLVINRGITMLFFKNINDNKRITYSTTSIPPIEYIKTFSEDYIIVDNLADLEQYLKYGKSYLDYNKPKTLVYENNKIFRFNEFDNFDNLEYRKGSKEFGGILTRLLEFLRIYKKIDDKLQFNIIDFEKKSNINIDDIKKLINAKESGMNLFDFNIIIDKDIITFSNFINTKNRPFESNNS